MQKKIMIGTALAGLITSSAMANWNGPYGSYGYDDYGYTAGPGVGVGVGPFGIYAGAAPYDGYGYGYAARPYGYTYAPRHHLRHHRMQEHSDMN